MSTKSVVGQFFTVERLTANFFDGLENVRYLARHDVREVSLLETLDELLCRLLNVYDPLASDYLPRRTGQSRSVSAQQSLHVLLLHCSAISA